MRATIRLITKRTLLIAIAASVLTVAPAAFAHHSYAMFDLKQTITVAGTVKEFQWTNPHSWIWLDVNTDAGAIEHWGIEGMSPNYLGRRGWSKHTLKPGDKISVLLHPVKNGGKGGSFVSVTLANGQVMRQTGDPPKQP